jgi:hypothetical protein
MRRRSASNSRHWWRRFLADCNGSSDATVTVRWPPSTRVYIRRRWSCFWLRHHSTYSLCTEQSQTRCTQSFPSQLLRAQRVWESRPPKSPSPSAEILAWVCGQSGFWGVYSWLLTSSARPALIKFLVAGAVRATSRCTSACVDCVRLHRTYTRDVSCEWSHWCLEHRFLRRVHSVLSNCAWFTVVYCLYASHTSL